MPKNSSTTKNANSVIGRALDLGDDDGFDLPSECEQLPRWKSESPTPVLSFTRSRSKA